MKPKIILPFALFFAVLVFAQCSKSTPAPASPSAVAVSGTIRDASTGAVMDSVKVGLDGNPTYSATTLLATYYTDKSGNFSFQFTPKSDYVYVLSVSKTGHQSVSRPISNGQPRQVFTISF